MCEVTRTLNEMSAQEIAAAILEGLKPNLTEAICREVLATTMKLIEPRDLRIATLEQSVALLGQMLAKVADSATVAIADVQRAVLELQGRGGLQ